MEYTINLDDANNSILLTEATKIGRTADETISHILLNYLASASARHKNEFYSNLSDKYEKLSTEDKTTLDTIFSKEIVIDEIEPKS